MDACDLSTEDYIIHISTSENSPAGNAFRLRVGGTAGDIFAVEDDGTVNFHGRLIGESVTAPISIKNTSSSSGARIAEFKQSGASKLTIGNDGFLDTQDGGIVLRASSSAPTGTNDDGDVYWRINAGVWTFAVYNNSAWVLLTLI